MLGYKQQSGFLWEEKYPPNYRVAEETVMYLFFKKDIDSVLVGCASYEIGCATFMYIMPD